MRLAGSNREATWSRIRSAGVELLFKHGYEAMNTRQLAEAAGLKPGSLYYYFASKEDFLHRLLVDLLQEIVDDLEEHLGGLEDVDDRLDAFVRVLVKWHVQRREETFIASIEVRALSQDRHQEYSALRDRFDAILTEILRDGMEQGRYEIKHQSIARNAILSALTAISGWYDPKGPLGLDDLVDDFLTFTRRMVASRRR